MTTEVIMPQMGESIAEGTITKWLVRVGETVERDQPLLEISTDKVDAEIPSPAAGKLLEIRFQEGATVPVDQVVAVIAADGEEGAAGTPAAAAPAAARAAASVSGPAQKVGAEASAAVASPAAAAASGGVLSVAERVRRYSSPLVRNMAAKEGVNLEDVPGTGVHGRVTKQDLLAFLEARKAPAAPAPPPSGAPVLQTPPLASPIPDFSVPAYREGDNVIIEPMSRIRQLTAAHMAYSKAVSAHVTSIMHMDMSRVVQIRNRAKAGFARDYGTKLTYMPFIFKATVAALQAYPKLNAAIDGSNIVYKKDINLGMAVALDWGLIVPVIQHADRLSLVGLAKSANDLADRARAKKLKPEEVHGGTFTITNPGAYGSLFGTPIINQPQVAILYVGVIEKRPVVVTDDSGHDMIAIKTMSYFGLSYDHRLVDGVDAERFLSHIKRTLAEETWSELDPYLQSAPDRS